MGEWGWCGGGVVWWCPGRGIGVPLGWVVCGVYVEVWGRSWWLPVACGALIAWTRAFPYPKHERQ